MAFPTSCIGVCANAKEVRSTRLMPLGHLDVAAKRDAAIALKPYLSLIAWKPRRAGGALRAGRALLTGRTGRTARAGGASTTSKTKANAREGEGRYYYEIACLHCHSPFETAVFAPAPEPFRVGCCTTPPKSRDYLSIFYGAEQPFAKVSLPFCRVKSQSPTIAHQPSNPAAIPRI